LIFIGDDVEILEHVWFSVEPSAACDSPRLVIGDRVRIGRCCQIGCMGEVVIEDDVLISDGVLVSDSYHRYDDVSRSVLMQGNVPPESIRVERGAFLGPGAQVLMGVTIGRNAYVDGNAIVTRDVASGTRVAGNPARTVN
jgi:maltose O-acetyltransferase